MPKTLQTKDIRLLKIVKRFPELYNSRHDLANDKAHSMVVWDTISFELDTPANVLKKKWQKLCSLYRKKCRTSRNIAASKNPATFSQDEVFLLMDSMMLETPGGDFPEETDDSSLCSAPTLSIISEEGRSTRSNSSNSSRSASTLATSEHRRDDGSPIGGGKIARKFAAEVSSAFPSAANISPADSAVKNAAPTSTRVLRSHDQRLRRATRSGPPELARNRAKEAPPTLTTGKTASTSGLKIRSISSENIDRKRKTRSRGNSRGSDGESIVDSFFRSVATTVAAFPRDVRAATKIKISNVVAETEYELSTGVFAMR